MNITIKEAKELKEKAQKDINDILLKLQTDTGMKIEDLDLDQETRYTVNQSVVQVFGCSIDMKL